ncbi:MAG: hypothetical protein WC391_09680 [Methanoregula sp.]
MAGLTLIVSSSVPGSTVFYRGGELFMVLPCRREPQPEDPDLFLEQLFF